MLDFWTERMIELDINWCWPKWCLPIYEQDLATYPVVNDRNTLALRESDDDYLRYFKASRGYSRPLGCHPMIWSLMIQGDTVLYHPEYFVHIINQTIVYPEDCELLVYIEKLCNTPVYQWSSIRYVPGTNNINNSTISSLPSLPPVETSMNYHNNNDNVSNNTVYNNNNGTYNDNANAGVINNDDCDDDDCDE